MNEIEKMFYGDVREKKRTGSNIFSRASTRRGGTKQPLRTPYFYMSSKERKKLNKEGDSFNMYNEIISKEKLLSFDKETQRTIMTEWRKKFQIGEIISKLKVSKQFYYDLLRELDITVDYRGKRKSRSVSYATQEELDKMKRDIAKYDEFLSLPEEQRYELLLEYLKSFTPQELGDLWGLNPQIIYNTKYRLSNTVNSMYKNGKSGNNNDTEVQSDRIDQTKEIVQSTPEESNVVIDSVVKNINIEDDFYFTLNQIGDSKSIIKKLELLIGVLDDNEDYNINITIQKKKAVVN